jgi:erythromycin esterase-like protein/ubiquitin-protein ligase/putative AlgH/UPF0301 family transcriptional regulator
LLVEAEWPDVWHLNLYITQPTSEFKSAKAALGKIEGSGKHMWQNHVFADLVEWMKHYNHSHDYSAQSMVYLNGIDCQQIYRSLRQVYNILSDLDFQLCQELKARLSFFNGNSENEQIYASRTVKGIGSEQIPETLQQILSEFQWTHFEDLKKRYGIAKLLDIINVEQNLEVVLNAEEYYRKSCLEPPGSQVSWNTRDQHMAMTILRIRNRFVEILQSDVKIMVWAHNSHIGNGAATRRGGRDFKRNECWNLGQMVKQLIPSSTLLGFDTYCGTVTALESENFGTTKIHPLNPAIPNTSAEIFHRVSLMRKCKAFLLELKMQDPEPWETQVQSMLSNWHIPNEYFVLYTDLNVYPTEKSETPLAKLNQGSRFGAIERIWGVPGSRLKLDNNLGYVEEYSRLGTVQLPVRPVEMDLDSFLSTPVLQRYVGVRYCPDDEIASHYSEGTIAAQYDFIIFVDRTEALSVLAPEELKSEHIDAITVGEFTNKHGMRRILQEVKQLRKSPVPGIRIAFSEADMHICFFVLSFQSGDYEGGEYFGKLILPKEYPMAPPAIFFYTPSGRFETGSRICVSFSDYHPELWNPSWGIESVLVGLQSFMQEECPEALGSIKSSAKTRRELARRSHEFNLSNKDYIDFFSDEQQEFHEEISFSSSELDEIICRYCRESGGSLVSPCECKGANKFVHLECLGKWQYQAILNQSTHPKYQSGLENTCNICQTEFNIKKFSRESLMVTFTGNEMANMIQVGCLLVATEKSSNHNLRLMSQYMDDPKLCDNLAHWTKSVFLITSIFRQGGKECIIGVNLTREYAKEKLPRKIKERIRVTELDQGRHLIGGPVEPFSPLLLVEVDSGCLNENLKSLDYVVSFHSEGFSLWCTQPDNIDSFRMTKDIKQVRICWGFAAWDRVQLLGEIARGGWGLALCTPELWRSDPTEIWSFYVKKAVVAGKNDFSEKFEDQ